MQAYRLHEKAWNVAHEKGEILSNQDVLNPLMDSMTDEGKLKIRMLPANLFPPGKVYFEDKHRMFYTDNPPKDEVLMHNNWISTKAAKIYRLKEHLQWMVDIDGYYSNPQSGSTSLITTMAVVHGQMTLMP